MKEAFTDNLRLSNQNRERLAIINAVISEFRRDNYVLTLRQLYYQLVSRDIIANNTKEYQKLSVLLTKGRMAGVVDWSGIEDRGRQPRLPFYCEGIKDGIATLVNQYRLDRQAGQEFYIEIWVEKEALSNIFLRTTEKYHVRLMVNKGYSSASAMYAAAHRYRNKTARPVLLYFGDHDPSGKDMVRDVKERLETMGVEGLILENPALTTEQVRQYNPPVNPAKITDPRAAWYIKKYGPHSWELDALNPATLTQIIENSLLRYIDVDMYEETLTREEKQKQKMINWSKKIKE